MTRSKHPGLYRIHEGRRPELREFLRCMGPVDAGRGQNAHGQGLATSWARRCQLLQTMCLQPAQDNLGHFWAWPIPATATSIADPPLSRPADASRHQGAAGQRYVPSLDDGGHRPHTARARARHLGKTGPDAVGLRAARRRSLARRRGLAQVLVRQGARGRGLQRHGHGRGQLASSSRWIRCTSKGWCMCRNWAASTSSSTTLHELRGERTGMRYRLTDKVQVQVSRVDLEARRISSAWSRAPASTPCARRQRAVRTTARAASKSGGLKPAAEEPDRQRCRAGAREPAGPPSTRGGEKPR